MNFITNSNSDNLESNIIKNQIRIIHELWKFAKNNNFENTPKSCRLFIKECIE